MIAAARLAWRSLRRHSRRTVFCVLATGGGLFFAIAYLGLSDGMIKDASERVDRTGLGHLQLCAAGFRDEQDPARLLRAPAALVSRLALPPGATLSARLVSAGLLTSAWGSRGVEVLGVDPVAEAGVSEAIRFVVHGEPLRADDAHGVLVGAKIAERLQLKPGSSVRLTVQRPDGELGAERLRVRGVFGGPTASLAGNVAYVTTAAAERILGVRDAAHQIVVVLPEGRTADALAPSLRDTVGSGVEVLTLGELVPLWKNVERLMDVVILAIILVIFLMVGLGILNVMLMSVLERTREFGVMMALGTRPRHVVAQVLWEGVWIATIGVVAGTLAGLALNAYGEAYGLLDYSADFGEVYEMSGMAISMKLRSALSVPRALGAAALVWTLTFLVGLYPAWRVARMRPVEAMGNR